MYVALLGLIGSSIDGFICGFLIKNLGVKMEKKQWVQLFCIIAICCFFAASAGKILSYTKIENYVDFLGFLLMLCLAGSAYYSIFKGEEVKNGMSVTVLAFSLAADASIVCMYLGLAGYNVIALGLTSAAFHSILMFFGINVGALITKKSAQKKAKFMSATVFMAIAVLKFMEIVKIK